MNMINQNEVSNEKEPPKKVKQLLKKRNYQILEYIDYGSTSKVFKVFKNETNFAAKVIDHSKISWTIKQYFLPNELKITAIIKHPFIIETEEIINDQDFSIIINEFADSDLVTVIEQQQKPNMFVIKCWVAQIIQALVYLHSQGITHRDIKLDNVLLCQGVAKLTDFTYSEYSIDPITKRMIPCRNFCGTIEYRAPETLLYQSPFDPFIADCFSLGVLIYILVTSEFPFGFGPHLRTANGLKQLYDDIQDKKWKINDDIKNDQRLYSLLKQLLNPDIDERITSYQALNHSWFSDQNLLQIQTLNHC